MLSMLQRFPVISKYFGFNEDEQPIEVLSAQLLKRGVTPYQLRKVQLKKKEEERQSKAKQQYEAVLRGIRDYKGTSVMYDLSNTDKRLVRNLRRTGSLTDAVIDAELERGVVSRAMTAFEHAAHGTPLDHVIHEDALAYALVRHPTMFTEDQIRLLKSRLDHGMSMNDFKDEFYKPNMVQDLRTRLLAPKPKPSKRSSYDGDFSACCSCDDPSH